MKHPHLLFLVAVALACVGLLAGLVSAPGYGYVFGIAILSELFALGCLWRLMRRDDRWSYRALVPGLIAIYTLTDVLLRMTFGMRMLDIFR